MKGNSMDAVQLGLRPKSKRHSWKATQNAFKRREFYPAECDNCRALVALTVRPSRHGARRLVEVEMFSTDGGKEWAEERPPCTPPA